MSNFLAASLASLVTLAGCVADDAGSDLTGTSDPRLDPSMMEHMVGTWTEQLEAVPGTIAGRCGGCALRLVHDLSREGDGFRDRIAAVADDGTALGDLERASR